MAERLFLFVQFEFPWVLGPPDGRYLLRSEADGEPERVIVLGTLGAARFGLSATGARAAGRARERPLRRAAWRRRAIGAQPEPELVSTARVTIVDPVSLTAERQAEAWLADLDGEREVAAAVAVLNRVLHAQRIATADPYAHEVSPAQALAIRAGWGEGEQVADGRWLHAVELPWTRPGADVSRRARKGVALRSEERMAELLGARDVPLLCEELTLRARLDLDQGRIVHAALELEHAYAAALNELRDDSRQDLALRLAELEKLRPEVAGRARAALAGEGEEELVRHSLERLEAALRARTAAGFARS